MRVISGIAKGHRLKAVPGRGTRPTSDRVKEAIFSMVGPYFDNEVVLDLFAGTGSLGIEALSRGCKKAVFVDRKRESIATIRNNLDSTGLAEAAECYQMTADRAIKWLQKQRMSFNLLFIDPPYRLKEMDELLLAMVQGGIVRSGATIVLEHDKEHEYPEQVQALSLTKQAVYGNTALSLYSMKEEEGDSHESRA